MAIVYLHTKIIETPRTRFEHVGLMRALSRCDNEKMVMGAQTLKSFTIVCNALHKSIDDCFFPLFISNVNIHSDIENNTGVIQKRLLYSNSQ